MKKNPKPNVFRLIKKKPKPYKRTYFLRKAANILAKESPEETIYIADSQNWIYILCAPSRTLYLVGREVKTGFYGCRRKKIRYDEKGRMYSFYNSMCCNDSNPGVSLSA